MNLGRLAYADFRAWRAPLALALVLLAVHAFGNIGALRYDRTGILARGEYLRLLTAHLCHHDAAHLGWNLAGLALVAWLFARDYSSRQWLAILLAATAVTDAGFLALQPELEWYVGFSGVLHGLMAAGLVAWWQRQRDALTVLVTLLFAAKLAWEHVHGALPFTADTIAIPVIHAAHTYGAIGGAACAAWIGLQKHTAPSSL
ncbi:MAG: rhombosortase [Steroidobacteraceae bacterium]